MSIKSAVMYWAACDGCGAEIEDYDGIHTLYETPEAATEHLDSADWHEVGNGKHACPKCVGWDDDGNYVLKPQNSGRTPGDPEGIPT